MDRKTKVIIITLLVGVFAYLIIEGCWIGNLICIFASEAEAEEMEGRQCWVLCMPDGIVNVRSKPKKNAEAFGGAMCGADMLTDGKMRNGFLHVYDIPAEENEGWISARYIVYDEPEAVNAEMIVRAEGRVACRKWIAGKITGWVRNGDAVTVYFLSEEWAVTSRGYIMTEFLEAEAE